MMPPRRKKAAKRVLPSIYRTIALVFLRAIGSHLRNANYSNSDQSYLLTNSSRSVPLDAPILLHISVSFGSDRSRAESCFFWYYTSLLRILSAKNGLLRPTLRWTYLLFGRSFKWDPPCADLVLLTGGTLVQALFGSLIFIPGGLFITVAQAIQITAILRIYFLTHRQRPSTMNRLLEIQPEDKGIIISQSKLIVVNGGACDFYTISLAERVDTPVVISIRATFGEVVVSPDTLQIKPEEYDKPRRIVVIGGKNREVSDSPEEDSSTTELLHYVTSKTPAYDGLAFRLTVVLVSTSGAILRSFGNNLHFQLAHQNTNKKSQTNPQKLLGLPAKTTVPQVSSGARHTCAVLQDGTLFGWGDGSEGQLALPLSSGGSGRTADVCTGNPRKDGTLGSASSSCLAPQPPTKSARTHNVVASPESRRAPLSRSRGLTHVPGGPPGSPRARAGTSGLVVAPVPRLISALEGEFVVQVGCGEAHTLILTLQGTMYAFGNAQNGRLGIPRPVDALGSPSDDQGLASLHRIRERGGLYANYSVPQLITGIPKVRVITVGAAFNACIDDRDCLYTWGSNAAGQLGLGHTDDVWQPQKVETFKIPLLQASCGKNHLLVLNYDGQVFATGDGGEGRLGLGDTHSRHSFERIKSLPPVRFVCAGGSHSAALDSGLLVWTWGSNCCGQLGLANWQPSAAFTAASVVADAAHAFNLQPQETKGKTQDRAVPSRTESSREPVLSVWGKGKGCGEEGLLKQQNSRGKREKRAGREPVKTSNDGDEEDKTHRDARKSILTAYCLAEGHESLSVKPQVVEFLREKQVVTLALGPLYSLAVTLHGFVYAWGGHEQGQLGLPDRLDNQPMPVLVPAFLFSPAVQVFASPCSNCSFVSSVADVINPFLPVSVSNSPLGAGSPSASRSASCCSPSAFPGASSSERSRLSKCDPETEASRAATSSSVSTGTVSSRARRTASFSRSPTGTSGTVSLPLSPRPGRETERNGDCWGDRRTEKVEPRRSASSSPRQRDSGDSGTARRRSRVEARRPSLLGRKHREGRDRSEERRDRRRKTDSRESRVERRSSPREKTEGRRLKTEEKRDGRRSPSREKREETRSVSREKREERRDQKGGSLSRLTRRRGAVNVSETVEAETHASGSAGRLCARYSRSPSQQTSERGKSVAETRKSRDWQGRESERCKGDDEEEALSGDGEEGLREESRDGGRRRRTEMHHSMKREDAAAASERIAQNRRIGHASCRGGPLNLRNASNPIGDEFGSWYRRLEETEEAERQAADLRYRLRRGEERMELLKKLSSRAEKSNKQVHTTKTPAVRRGRSAPEEAEPEKKTKACNSSRPISPHASTRTDPVSSSISSKEESFAKTADTRQPRRAACLFSASCRKREVNRFRQLHSVHVRGSQGEKVVQIDVSSLDFLPPACWPEAVETAAAAACIAPSKRRLAAGRALDPASWGALAHAASPRKETDLSSPFQAEPPQFLVPWKRWNPRTGEAIPLYSNAVLLQCTFTPTETSARLYR